MAVLSTHAYVVGSASVDTSDEHRSRLALIIHVRVDVPMETCVLLLQAVLSVVLKKHFPDRLTPRRGEQGRVATQFEIGHNRNRRLQRWGGGL
jgi:hypothetical protein